MQNFMLRGVAGYLAASHTERSRSMTDTTFRIYFVIFPDIIKI